MSVDAVVLNWRDAQQTIDCVNSLLAEDRVSRIIVVDNESSGLLRHVWAEEPRVYLSEQSNNLGFSAGVNVGLRLFIAGDASQVLIINNDAVIAAGGVSLLSNALESDPRLGMVAPRILNADGREQKYGEKVNKWTLSIREATESEDADYLTWACVMLPRKTVASVGFLDERYFMYWEDVDYGFRVRAAGGRLAVCPTALVTHNTSSSHSKAGNSILAYSAAGVGVFGRSHGSRLTSIVRPVAKALRLRLRGDAGGAMSVWRGIWVGARIRNSAYQNLERLLPKAPPQS